jgi:glucose/arabinose dehydrogenase
MKHLILILVTSACLAFFGCKDDVVEDAETSPGVDSLASVETNAPNADYRPAFKGQTRIGGVRSTTNWEGRILTQSLQSPWGITSLPDGRLLITEKAGTMRIVTITGQMGAPIAGIPAVDPGGQGGLLGVRVDPDFSNTRMIYWVFSESTPDGNLTSVARGRLSANETVIENAGVIYRATPAYRGTAHYGGRILFDPAGNLLISTGERSDMSTRPQAQSLTSGLGKIVRITKEGRPVAGNPFEGQTGARPELYSYGFRNPQGLAFHPETGDLWESEHGPRGGDEINLVEPGANYGWPTITYGLEYSGARVGSGIQQQDGMEQPVYYWDPVVSPSGMTFYSSDRIPEWRNNLFVGSLSGMHIVRLVIEDNRIVGEERLLAGESQRFRDITQGSDGALYAITDQGRLYRIDRI